MRSISDRLRLVRKHLGLNQSQLAEKLGVSLRTWQRYEQGALEPTLGTLLFFREQGVDLNWLADGDGDILGMSNHFSFDEFTKIVEIMDQFCDKNGVHYDSADKLTIAYRIYSVIEDQARQSQEPVVVHEDNVIPFLRVVNG